MEWITWEKKFSHIEGRQQVFYIKILSHISNGSHSGTERGNDFKTRSCYSNLRIGSDGSEGLKEEKSMPERLALRAVVTLY